MKMNNKKRFTLIELIIVIVVIGILAGMALPKFMGVTKDAKVASLKNDVDVLQTAKALIDVDEDVIVDYLGTEETIQINGKDYSAKPLVAAVFKDKLSKLPKTAEIGEFYEITVDSITTDGDLVEGTLTDIDLVGTIVRQTGLIDSKGDTWYGTDVRVKATP